MTPEEEMWKMVREKENSVVRSPLRDDFAKAALQGMLAHSRGHGYTPRNPDHHWHDAIAEEAYEIADAMLKERNKPE